MDTLSHAIVMLSLMSHAVLAWPQAYSNRDEIRQGALNYVLRLLEHPAANFPHELTFQKDKMADLSKELQDSGEILEEKTKKSPLYRLNGPINRQTRLAAFGSLIVPKYSDSHSRNVLRYGK